MRPSGRRALPWLVALCVTLALGLGGYFSRGYLARVASPRERPPARREPAAGHRAPKAPGLEFRGTFLKVIDPRTGRVAWELSLDKAESVTETGEAWLTGITAVYHNLDGTDTRLSARKAHLEAGGKALAFTDQVELSATNGGSLQAWTLRWEAGQEEFLALGAPGGQVQFRHGPTALRAPEIRGDLALKRVRASGGVRFLGRELLGGQE